MTASPEKILVTGGAGFIASHLCEALLAEAAEITILDDFNDFYDPAIKEANIEAYRARLAELLSYAQPLLAPNGRCIFLKGERAQEEIAEAHEAGWLFDVRAHPSRLAPDSAALEIRNLRRAPGLAATPHGKL